MPLFTSDIEIADEYPTIEPSLRLDFAGSRTLDSSMKFLRASGATYVGKDGLIRTVVENEPRFDHDPTTGESLGILFEELRTNYQPYSVDINTGKSFLTGSTLTSNAATAPDGTTTATRIAGSGTDESTRLGWTTQPTQTNMYNVFSVFVKADSGTPILGFYSNTFVAGTVAFNIDLSDGTTNTLNGGSNFFSKVVAYTNGWYRVTVAGGLGSGASGSWNINLVQSLTSARAASSGTNNDASYLVWGVQEELSTTGPFPTSYFPTFAATNPFTATRYKEIAYSDTSKFLSPGEGTIITKFTWLDIGTQGGQGKVLFSLNKIGGFGDGIYVSNEVSTTSTSIRILNNSNGEFSEDLFTINPNPTELTLALAYEKDNVGISKNGGSVLVDSSATIPTMERLVIGDNAWGLDLGSGYSNQLNPANCHIKSFIYYPKRLVNNQLRSLTQ